MKTDSQCGLERPGASDKKAAVTGHQQQPPSWKSDKGCQLQLSKALCLQGHQRLKPTRSPDRPGQEQNHEMPLDRAIATGPRR
mmetsp:Transcript_8962/g.13231  ORF Transcript_8962/g.13231 Transcript_8962/m.13231 type:complete len:83 (-) Transcript_8962:278-526(-)